MTTVGLGRARNVRGAAGTSVFLGEDLGLHVVDYGGPDDAVPVVLVHGVTGCTTVWDECARTICGRRRTVAVDLRGHGDSRWLSDGGYTTERFATDLSDVIEWLGGVCDVVGLSWGGLVGVHLASERPASVRRLAVVDAAMGFDQAEADVPARPRRFDTIEEVIAWERAANSFAGETPTELFARMSCRPGPEGGWERKHDPVFFERWPFRNDSRWEQFAGLKQPILLVRGRESFVMPAAVAARMCNERPRTDFVEVPDSGHLVALDAPDALGAALNHFLSAPEDRSASYDR
ncbi:alpha/beta hydrolase [Streptomyces sp. NPDC005708]|uniref:alpha/beta fold hydrolase n=1 Tax=Streptomyces sp. NPDC005708 TaxID=3154564 RepID=UPI0033ECC499